MLTGPVLVFKPQEFQCAEAFVKNGIIPRSASFKSELRAQLHSKRSAMGIFESGVVPLSLLSGLAIAVGVDGGDIIPGAHWRALVVLVARALSEGGELEKHRIESGFIQACKQGQALTSLYFEALVMEAYRTSGWRVEMQDFSKGGYDFLVSKSLQVFPIEVKSIDYLAGLPIEPAWLLAEVSASMAKAPRVGNLARWCHLQLVYVGPRRPNLADVKASLAEVFGMAAEAKDGRSRHWSMQCVEESESGVRRLADDWAARGDDSRNWHFRAWSGRRLDLICSIRFATDWDLPRRAAEVVKDAAKKQFGQVDRGLVWQYVVGLKETNDRILAFLKDPAYSRPLMGMQAEPYGRRVFGTHLCGDPTVLEDGGATNVYLPGAFAMWSQTPESLAYWALSRGTGVRV